MDIGFEPFGDRVLIKPLVETKTRGGLLLPDNVVSEKKPNRGTVLLVGPGRVNKATGLREPVQVTPGDDVLIFEFSGRKITLGEDIYILVSEQDIMGRFTGAATEKQLKLELEV